jgi:adenylate cyclase
VSIADQFVAAGLLTDDCEASDQIELVEWLSSLGFDLEQMRTAVEGRALSGLAGDYRTVPGSRLTRNEASERSGLTTEQIDAVATGFGFTPINGSPEGEIGFTEDEIRLFRDVHALASIFSQPETDGLLRVIGSTFGRLGEAIVSVFLTDVESPHMQAGESQLQLAHKIYEAVGLLDGFTDRLDPILRRHVLQAVERNRRASIGQERATYRFAVGFVDLVGFTEHTQQLTSAELARFVRDFEGRAHDVATNAGARVVKLIGDEVMFVATDATAACRAAAALMDGFGEVGATVLPRGGLAFGDVLTRGGDYYGTVVNLASRLVDHAVPQELLATSAFVAAAAGCDFEPAGRRTVKGALRI